MNQHQNIYSTTYIKTLFDEMSQTYGMVNYISSFGFTKRWRRQCVEQIVLAKGMKTADLMTGMGECWTLVLDRIGHTGHLTALDLSPMMLQKARQQLQNLPDYQIEILQEDVLDNDIPDMSADSIISTFGLKTFSNEQQTVLAGEIQRILKPGGVFSLLEVSVPPHPFLRVPYMFYLKKVIPVIGKLFLGNPDNYRMLGIYTENFGSCAAMGDKLRAAGLQVTQHDYFWGCATGVSGQRPFATHNPNPQGN
jgi:demethylmenaquinone methyltransferase/2-methoxy-6-polyprenyl-1,4-benzoquinol methylase